MTSRDKTEDRPAGDAPEADISPEEIRDAIEDPGYSGDQRKANVKVALTDLEQRTDLASGERRQLVRRVRTTIDSRQPGPCVSNGADRDDSSI